MKHNAEGHGQGKRFIRKRKSLGGKAGRQVDMKRGREGRECKG